MKKFIKGFFLAIGGVISHFLKRFPEDCVSDSENRSVVSDSLRLCRLYSPWNSPGQNTGVGSLSLLEDIIPTSDWTQVSHIAGGFFTSWAIREDQEYSSG